MLKIKCPKCKQTLELGNEAGGARVACSCGMAFLLPAAPPSGDFQVCGDCMKLCEKDAKICSGCGFNFISGQKAPERRGDIPDYTAEKMRERRRKLFVNVLTMLMMALIAAGLYSTLTKSKIGLSTQCPIGKFSKQYRYNGNYFRPFASAADNELKLLGLTAYEYIPNPNAKQKYTDRIVVAADETGKIHAACCRYNLPPALKSFAGTPGAHFAQLLRFELHLPEEPEWRTERKSEGRFHYIESKAEYKKPGFHYRHRKTENSFGMQSEDHEVECSASGFPEVLLKKLPYTKEEAMYLNADTPVNVNTETEGATGK